MRCMGLLARTCLPAALVLGLMSPAIAGSAERPSICKSKKKKVVKKKKTAAKKPAKAKVNALTISKWQKKKVPDDQIVEKATAAGYKVTKAEKKKLLKYKVKKPLIARLEGKAAEGAVADAAPATKAPPSFDLEKTMDPNDIDFDSVPPPKGMPDDLAKKQKQEATESKKPAQPAK